MKKYFTLLFIITLFAYPREVTAQQARQLLDCVKTGHVGKVFSYVQQPHNFDYSCLGVENLYWEQYRELIPNYYQGVIYSRECQKYPDGTGSDLIARVINLLVKDSTIIYFSVIKPFPKPPVTISVAIPRHDLYQQLLANYPKYYKTPLDTNELFKSTVFSVGGCGEAATTSKELIAVREMAKNKAFQKLNSWLSSPNVEKQLYAVYGYEILRAQNVRIPPETLKIIDLIRQKKGKVEMCLGCLFDPWDIQEAAALIPDAAKRFVGKQQ